MGISSEKLNIEMFDEVKVRFTVVRCEKIGTNTCIDFDLEAFHMMCQRQITKIRWQDHIRNSEVAARTGLGPVSDLITRRRNSVFGHIARLSEDTPATKHSGVMSI